MSDTYVVLIPSCDAYRDLWPPFFWTFWRQWTDCPFEVALGSNGASYDDERVRMLHSDAGLTWSNRMLDFLAKTDADYVLLMLEDFFLRETVNTQSVLDIARTGRERGADCVYLNRRRNRKQWIVRDGGVCEIPPGARYRVSTQAAIWRREALLALLTPGESIWQFELCGSERSTRECKVILSAVESVLPYGRHVVERGKWFPDQARHFAGIGAPCDFKTRGVMNWKEYLTWRLQMTCSGVVRRFPVLDESGLAKSLRVRKYAGVTGMPRS